MVVHTHTPSSTQGNSTMIQLVIAAASAVIAGTIDIESDRRLVTELLYDFYVDIVCGYVDLPNPTYSYGTAALTDMYCVKV